MALQEQKKETGFFGGVKNVLTALNPFTNVADRFIEHRTDTHRIDAQKDVLIRKIESEERNNERQIQAADKNHERNNYASIFQAQLHQEGVREQNQMIMERERNDVLRYQISERKSLDESRMQFDQRNLEMMNNTQMNRDRAYENIEIQRMNGELEKSRMSHLSSVRKHEVDSVERQNINESWHSTVNRITENHFKSEQEVAKINTEERQQRDKRLIEKDVLIAQSQSQLIEKIIDKKSEDQKGLLDYMEKERQDRKKEKLLKAILKHQRQDQLEQRHREALLAAVCLIFAVFIFFYVF